MLHSWLGLGGVWLMTPGRRDVLFGGAATLLIGGGAKAQSGDPLAALEKLGLAEEIRALMPGKPLDIVRVLATIFQLESAADQRKLPVGALSFKTVMDGGPALPTSQAGLYSAAVPRLVRVIDRSEGADPALSDEAGKLLAELNEAQRSVPEALQEPVAPSRSMNFDTLKDEYSTLFSSAQLRSDRTDLADWHKRVLLEYRSRYENVSKDTGVPWFFIGAIHGLEASYNFRAHLHNGDFPLSARTRQVPAGRPKLWSAPYSWEASARDALKLMGFSGRTDWTLERTLYRLEAYNGFGYRKRGVPTPYLWSFSNHYEAGKFVSDGKWNPEARSQQCGAATTMKMLMDVGAISFA
jgi:lysozyme family protein